MLTFNFHNCMDDAVGATHGLTEKELADFQPRLARAHQQLVKWREQGYAAFLDAPFQIEQMSSLLAKAHEVQQRFSNIAVLGIGGSALGLKSLAQALLHPYHNLQGSEIRKGPRLFILDNIDPDTCAALLDSLNLKETCFIVISKSGGTTETMAQFFLVQQRLQKMVGHGWREHLVIITDPEKGELCTFVQQESIASFFIPPKLGGRFSVFSPVGLFPAACVGIDIQALLEGARAGVKRVDEGPSSELFRLAAIHYLMDTQKKKPMAVMFPYSDALSAFADSFVQLFAESLGKEGRGSTPLKAMGAADQHSQLQLFMEGPNDKLITFMGVKQFRSPKSATALSRVPDHFLYMNDHSLGEILQAQLRATSGALRRAERPNIVVTLAEINERTMGELIMSYQLVTVIAGALYEINPFDQPGVELAKVLTREFLSRKQRPEMHEPSQSSRRS